MRAQAATDCGQVANPCSTLSRRGDRICCFEPRRVNVADASLEAHSPATHSRTRWESSRREFCQLTNSHRLGTPERRTLAVWALLSEHRMHAAASSTQIGCID